MPDDDPPKLMFNCYLLDKALADPEHALRPKYRSGGEHELSKLAPTSVAPSGAIAYFGTSDPKTPRWAELLSPMFHGLDVLNQTNRLVIFMPVRKRTFALCFGYGGGALEWDCLETSFGLRFAARKLKPDQVTELRSRRIDATARTQEVSVATGGELRDLGVELEGEFVRKLVGRLDSGIEDVGGSVVAGDSISFRSGTNLHAVKEILGRMLDEVTGSEAQDEFEFIDALDPLRNSSQMVKDLMVLLGSKVLERNEDGVPDRVKAFDVQVVEFAPPDDVKTDEVDSYVLTYSSRSVSFADPSLEALRTAIAEAGVRRGHTFLTDARVTAIGADGVERSKALALVHWLVFEAGTSSDRYVLTLGRWFQLREHYTEKLNADLKKIPDVTADLGLIPWPTGDEGDYNLEAAKADPDLLHMDKDQVSSDGRGTIEVCDLLHIDGYLIHVKRYNGSQTLSHLFAQGAVSASLLNGSEDFRNEFEGKVKAKDPRFAGTAKDAPQRVTYAIGLADERNLPLDLPTFSKVNLRDLAQRLRNARVEPTLARIEMGTTK